MMIPTVRRGRRAGRRSLVGPATVGRAQLPREGVLATQEETLVGPRTRAVRRPEAPATKEERVVKAALATEATRARQGMREARVPWGALSKVAWAAAQRGRGDVQRPARGESLLARNLPPAVGNCRRPAARTAMNHAVAACSSRAVNSIETTMG
jgi:hypothetical protein